MYAFTFERPSSTADAAKHAAAGGAKVLAGGQTLLASMKLRLANPEMLVDLGGIPELAGVRPALAPPLDGTGLAASLVRPVGLAEVPLSAAEFVASGVAVSSGTSVTSPVGPAVGRAVAPGAPTAV